MAQVKTNSASLNHQPDVKNKITKLTKHLPSDQKSTVLRASKVLAELSPSQRREALALLEQRNNNGGLDYRWITEFLTVLGKLKAQESCSVTK
ncbi:MAG: hypothetical protein ACYS1A_12515 [Planctomycetota bacterium]|jgi:hypothetical protein